MKRKGAARTVGGLIKLLKKTALQRNAVEPVTSDDGKTFFINDGIVVAQGPNYALAKRIQHWRAMLARLGRACCLSVCVTCVCVCCVLCVVCVCVVCLSHAPLWCWAPPIPFFSPLCARACARVCVCAGARAAPCPPTLRRRLQRFLWCTTRSSRLRTAAFRSFSPLRSPGRWVFCASWGVSHTQTHTHTDTHTRTHTHAHTHTRVKMVA